MNDVLQIDHVWTILFGQGPLPRDEAIKNAALELKEQGITQFKRLRKDGPLWSAIDKSILYGIRIDKFDRPKRGHIRAIAVHPDSYEPRDWERAVKAVMGDDSMDQDQVIRAAAEWARDNMGLEFERLRKDGVIYKILGKLF